MEIPTHYATLNVACPECKADKHQYCYPVHKNYVYDSPIWTHKARHTAYDLFVSMTPPGVDKTIYVEFDAAAYRTDKALVADVDADIKGVLKILGKYGKAWAA